MIKAWQRFWFAPRDLYNVSLFRVAVALTLFTMYLFRQNDLAIFFYEAGLVPSASAREILPDLYRSPWPFFFHGDTANFLAHVGLLVGLALLVLGVIGRSFTWVIWVLHLGFMQRNYALVYGVDLFANFWLFYLSFINHNRHLNILNVWRARGSALTVPDVSSDFVSSAFTRMIQIQLCVSYAYTGIEKLKGQQWWEGTAVWYTLGMRELITWDLTFLREWPWIIGVLSMTPVIFEVYFPFGVFIKKLRAPWLLFGFLFHLGTAIVLDLWFFCFIMAAAYFLFIDSQKLRECVAFINLRVAQQVKSKIR